MDGLRIDHPDGLADPARLPGPAGGSDGRRWVVVEKILEGDERLADDWACAGTTGYDALLRVGGLFVDPDGAEPLAALSEELLGEPQDLASMTRAAKRHVVERVLPAEIHRLLRLVGRALPWVDQGAAQRVLEALLIGMDRYRVYVRPDEPVQPDDAEALRSAAARGLGDAQNSVDRDVLTVVIDLALGRAAGVADAAAQRDFVVRFQQTCGPVMAKAVEDTVYYRYVRLVGLGEVGGDPGRFGVAVPEFHAFAERIAADWPLTMTTLSTHDTKRSEDVRARLAVLSERPAEWSAWVRKAWGLAAAHRDERVDPLTEYFLWQTVVGAWPISAERLVGYATKAVREAKLHTAWVDGDSGYEAAVARFCRGIATDADIAQHVEAWLTSQCACDSSKHLGPEGDPADSCQEFPTSTRDRTSSICRSSTRTTGVPWTTRSGGNGWIGSMPVSGRETWPTRSSWSLRRPCGSGVRGPRSLSGPGPAMRRSPPRPSTPSASVADPVARTTCSSWPRVVRDDSPAAAGGVRRSSTLPSGSWRNLLSDNVVAGGAAMLRDVVQLDGLPVAILVRDDVRRTR